MSRGVQLSDLHMLADPKGLLGQVNTQASLEKTLAKVIEYQPDFVVLTGDISQDGSLLSYQRLAKTLEVLACPVYWLLGNHDEYIEAAQGLQGSNIRSDKYFIHQGWQFILLNSTAFGLDDGFLGSSDFAQLHRYLNLDPERPTIIMLHHPPVKIGCYMDDVRLINDREFLQNIATYYQLRAVLFGHIHQAFAEKIGEVFFLGAPATSVQFAPKLPKFALDKQAQPGFRWLDFSKDNFQTGIIRV